MMLKHKMHCHTEKSNLYICFKGGKTDCVFLREINFTKIALLLHGGVMNLSVFHGGVMKFS